MQRMHRRCKLCHEPILRAPTTLGHRAAFDAAPIRGANWRMEGGRMRFAPGPDLGYTSHFSTCSALPPEVLLGSSVPSPTGQERP